MVKIVFCLRRRSPLSHAQFQSHWREVHAPLVEKHRQALRIVRYMQSGGGRGTMTEKLRAFRGSPEPYDGVAEIWYESLAALESLARSPEARAASRELLEDERRFIDHARSPIWLAEETVIIADAPQAG